MHTKIHAWKFRTHTYFQSDRAALGNQEYIAMGVSTCTWYDFQDYKINLSWCLKEQWNEEIKKQVGLNTQKMFIYRLHSVVLPALIPKQYFASNVSSSFLTMLVCSIPFKSRQNWLVTYLIICHILMSLIQTTGHKMAALTVTAVFLQLCLKCQFWTNRRRNLCI